MAALRPGDDKPAAAITPKSGDRYGMTKEGGRFAVKKE